MAQDCLASWGPLKPQPVKSDARPDRIEREQVPGAKGQGALANILGTVSVKTTRKSATTAKKGGQ